ncbi:MAG: class I SAM-dependent methyltransferase [Chloroflexota bacterium]|nr:class I SAM-dependent methyltransferase [Chloroflexota bacterium]
MSAQISARYGDALNHIIDEIVARYGVGRRFAAAYLARYESADTLPTPDAMTSVEDFLHLPPQYSNWFIDAMSTNDMGEANADWLMPYLPLGARRILDIDCGIGGTLRAFTRRGFEAVGFDGDADNVNLARANAHDVGRLNAVTHGDILDANFVASLGTFDFVTMFGVMGIVHDPARALRHALSRLAAGGVLVFDALNPDAIANIDSQTPPLEYYARQIERADCDVERIDSPFFPAYISIIESAIDNFQSDTAIKAHVPHTAPIARQFAAQIRRSTQIGRLIRDYNAYQAGALDGSTFAERYALARWTLLVRAAPLEA